jgi:transposase-like protein
VGRSTKYNPDITPQLAKQYAREGLIDKEIAPRLGITTSTLYEWKKKYPEFSDALKHGKEFIDSQVEDSLLKRALGYEIVEEEFKRVVGPLGVKQIRVKKVRKHIPPDVAAAIIWLKNRQSKRWRDKVDEHGIDEKGESNYADALTAAAEEVWDEEKKQAESNKCET